MMTTRDRVLLWVSCAALAASTIACGNSMSATGPSNSSGSGAVISGRVNVSGSAALNVAARFPLAVSVAVPLANSSSSTVTVTIEGTNISSTVDGNGNFTLTNVPAGTVQLHFQGRGADAMLTISGIQSNDNLQITVTLNGRNANLDSRNSSSNNNNNGVLVNGRIDSIVVATRTLRVGTDSVVADNSTTIRHGNQTFAFTDLKVGDHIQVKGTRDGSTVRASEIKVENDDGDDNEDNDHDNNGNNNSTAQGTVTGLGGTCPSVTFFIGSTKVTTSLSTRFEDVTCLMLANSMKVEVKGTKANDGTLMASTIEKD